MIRFLDGLHLTQIISSLRERRLVGVYPLVRQVFLPTLSIR
jgi:hypothetical protein